MAEVRSGSVGSSTYNNVGIIFSWEWVGVVIGEDGTPYSQISWKLTGNGRDSSEGVSYYKAGGFLVTVIGQNLNVGQSFTETLVDTGTGYRINLYKDTVIARGNFLLPHNNGGSSMSGYGGFVVYISAAINTDTRNVRGDGRFQVPTQKLVGLLITPEKITIGGNPVVLSIQNHQKGNSYTITFASRGDSSIPTQTVVSNTTASAMFWAAPQTLYQYIVGAEKDIQFTCTTYSSNGTAVGSTTTDATLVIAETDNLPTIDDITITQRGQAGDKTAELTGSTSRFILNYSQVNYEVTSTAATGATITATNIVNGGQIRYGPTGTFYNPITSDVFTATVTDSRGFRNAESINVDAVNYVPLTCVMELSEPNANGEIQIKVSGNYWTGNFGAVTNTLSLKYRLSLDGIAGTNYDLTPTINSANNTYTCTATISGLDHTQLYYIRVRAQDKADYVETDWQTFKVEPIFDWSSEDFNINVPVTMQSGLAVTGNFTLNGNSPSIPIVGTWTPELREGDGGTNQYLSELSAEGIYVRIGDYCIISWYLNGIFTPTTPSSSLPKICIWGLPFKPDGSRWWSGGGTAEGFGISRINNIDTSFSGWCIENVNTSGTARWAICGRTNQVKAGDSSGLMVPSGSGYLGIHANFSVYSSGTIMYRVATTT